MEWREVSLEEYQEIFGLIRELIEKIEHDPKIGHRGFEVKQELREIVRSLIKIENKLYTGIAAEKARKVAAKWSTKIAVLKNRDS